jgi:hypothetical protein
MGPKGGTFVAAGLKCLTSLTLLNMRYLRLHAVYAHSTHARTRTHTRRDKMIRAADIEMKLLVRYCTSC